MAVNKRTGLFFFAVLAVVVAISSFADDTTFSAMDPMLARWEEFSHTPDAKRLLAWLRCHARARLIGGRCGERFETALPPYFGRLGIFITLKKGKKVRGCYGAFSHTGTDIQKVFLDYLSGALTGDARYTPLDAAELETTEIIVSITSPPYAVGDPDSVDLFRYGVSISCGEEPVRAYVPAELMSAAELKSFVRRAACQVSAFRAVTIRSPISNNQNKLLKYSPK